MSWSQAQFWLESMVYDAELTAETMQGEGAKETHSLDELARVLPKTESEQNGVKHQG